MKTLFLSVIIITALSVTANAQLREHALQSPDYTGTITHSNSDSQVNDWMNLLNMTMSHSYSMTFSNFGGQMQNLNAYTNHMLFDINDRMNARVDISVLHSPFGNSFMNMNNNSLGSRIIIQNAEFEYKISNNTSISLQFSQSPYYNSGFSSFGNPFHRNRFGSSFYGY
jgi:hypothetical protein